MNIGAAHFGNTLVRYYEATTGVVDGATFEFDTTARHYLLQLYSTGAVTVRDSTFRRTGNTADLRGVYMSGTAEVTPQVLDNTFEEMTWGIYVEPGPLPVVSGNTFVNCTTDTFGL
jgi:hypothetical protein